VFFSTDVMIHHQKVQVRPFAVFPAMFDNKGAKIIILQSGPCRPLESLDDFLNLFVGRLVLRCKGNHGRRIGIFVPQTVRQARKKYRVPPPHDHLFIGSFSR
jgi:hypothetical protein